MPSQYRIADVGFLLALAFVALIGDCGEHAFAQTKQEAVNLTREQKFAATLKKAEAGDAQAQYDAGFQYHFRIAIRDAAKAIEWYEKAALQGHAHAQQMLGRIYLLGKLVPKDPKKALVWLQKSAAQGDDDAQELLGWMYHNGEGVPKDAAKASEWYRKAAENGNASAQLVLSWSYFHGTGVSKSLAKAFEWCEKSAEAGNTEAQLRLGVIYEEGIGVPKNPVKAVEWYQKAAENEYAPYAPAQHNLGLAYFNGIGVPKDAFKAAEWWLKAAAQGFEDSQGNLGIVYSTGQGVPRDYVLAYAWQNLAARGGAKLAIDNRKLAESRLSPLQIAEGQRLSASWKEGQILVREGKPAAAGASPASGSPSKQGTGTAFLVSNTGQAVTNHHVIDGCREVKAEGRDGVVKVITSDAVNDLALLQVPGTIKATASITSEPGKLRQGEDIVAFGFPLNSVLSSGGNLTPGVVSALTGLGNNTNQIQITAPIQPGSSGSPVLNKKGDVIGVVSMKLSDLKMARATGSVGQNVNFAVNGQTLKSFLDTHKVTYSSSGFFSREKSAADLADEARKWTLVVECWK